MTKKNELGRIGATRKPALLTALSLAAVVGLATACLLPFARRDADELDLAQHVNPFVGTGGHGHTYPGATVPFGMVQLSPDTRLTGWDGCSAYHDSDDAIHGFSHTHLSGTGVSDYGDVLLTPVVGPLETATARGVREDAELIRSLVPSAGDSTLAEDERTVAALPFDKATERASPGYYRAVLRGADDQPIEVELTAGARVGVHRYSFPSGHERQLHLDLAHRDEVVASTVRADLGRIVGSRLSRAWARDQRVYFAIDFSVKPRALRFDRPPEERDANEGRALRIVFPSSDEPLVVAVGLSATSEEAALANLEAELGQEIRVETFDTTHRAARSAWNRELARVTIDEQGADPARLRVFYTALYHSFVAPNLFSDADGGFRDLAGENQEGRGHDVYTVFSLWDTFRTAHPLYTILQQERTEDFVATMLSHYEDGGRLPVWELAGNETDCMIGYHAVSAIADALAKEQVVASAGAPSMRGEQGERLYTAARHSAMLDQRGQDAFKKHGFIPSELESESVSKTLEYGYDDWCLARMAADVGRPDDREMFLRRSQAYRHLFDPETGFMRPKWNGGFKTPFDPREVDFNFTEANCWQYTFFVPHDTAGMIDLLGGDEKAARKLDEMFTAPVETTGRDQADITGLIGQYAHGNEPSHHVAWLYNHVGQPWKAQQRVHQILTTLYADAPDGLCGNEDCGQMSAWFVMSALGIYPLCPGSTRYELGAPLFAEACLRLESGAEFTIRKVGADGGRPADSDLYVQRVTLDGADWPNSWIEHARIVRGGELVVHVGPEPSDWATRPEHRGTTSAAVDGQRVLAVPFVVGAENRSFRDRTTISLGAIDEGVTIRYTLDGSSPLADTAREYDGGSIVLDDSVRLRAVSTKEGHPPSPEIEAGFHRVPEDWVVTLADDPHSQYTSAGADTLIDGLRGTTSWRNGSWLGYQGPFAATLDLGEVQRVDDVTIGFLQDMRAWIWMPREITVSVSTDGEAFEVVGTQGPEVDDRDGDVQVRDYVQAVGRDARFVRIETQSYGEIQDWHPGVGGQGFIFVDEVMVGLGG